MYLSHILNHSYSVVNVLEDKFGNATVLLNETEHVADVSISVMVSDLFVFIHDMLISCYR